MTDWVEFFRKTNRNIYKQVKRSNYLLELIIDNTPNGGKILEAGCGTALLSIILADYGFDATAMDLSTEVLDFAQQRVVLKHGRIQYVQGDLYKLRDMFEKSSFDIVFNQGVMEHFSEENIVKILEEIRHISSKFIFSVPNYRKRRKKDLLYGDENLMSNMKWVKLIKSAGYNKVIVVGGDTARLTHILPRFCFSKNFSFWRKYVSVQSIFICE